MMVQLITGGFRGDIWPVNPRYEEVEGRPCIGSLAELPSPVDLAILGVSNRLLEAQLSAAAEASVAAAVIFASGHDEPDHGRRARHSPPTPGLLERLSRIAKTAGMSICGANCMGFVNLDLNLRALAFAEREDLEPGHITWISHSGSAFTALLHNDRGLRFNLAVSPGQELTTTIADYIAYALGRDSTEVIALFLEAVRDPDGYRAALADASARGIPVVALKVGRDAAASRLVTAHSGALAGEDAVHQAVFDAHGVVRVTSLGEMADTLELLGARRRARPGGLAAIHDSGGERAHLVDAAAAAGVPFATLSEATTRRLREVLEPGLPAVNPLDAWGTGNDYETTFLECMRALVSDPGVGALAFVVDLAGEDLEWGYASVAEKIYSETDLPVAVLCNLASAIDRPAAMRLRSAGVPVLEDTIYGLAAFRHLFELRDFTPPPRTPRGAGARPTRAGWRARLGTGGPWTEVEALALLDDYGIATARSEMASTLEEAIAAARRLSYPLALKLAGVAHKSDVGGVRLGVSDDDDLAHAYEALSRSRPEKMVVQEMVPGGTEVALGLVHDDQFGPIVLVAAGGVHIELFADRALALPPVDPTRAQRLIDSLRMRPLLDAVRGAPAADVGALSDAVVALSNLALDLGDRVGELDVNPVIVGPRGCTAVDALLVPLHS
jgi:acyl-CoA synthetase (NDP forming)